MTKPESYPFLRIARRHSVDYGDVLNHAQFCKGAPAYRRARFPLGSKIDNEVQEATNIQRQIRAGLIDWDTGERG